MSYRESQDRIEAANYARDPRTQPAAGIPRITKDITCPTCEGDGNDCPDCEDGTRYFAETELAYKFDVCPVCEGKGTHVNPNIDSGGLTADDFYDDPDFRENYFSGHYDQTCNRCQGKRVVPVIDEARCSEEDLASYNEMLDDDAAYDAERLAEIRAGC